DCSRTKCENTCGGRGTCPDVETGCVCNPGWKGENCTQQYCVANCNADLGQGVCVNQTCKCSPAFFGSSCSQKRCPPSLRPDSPLRFKNFTKKELSWMTLHGADEEFDPLACSRHGVCVNGVCACRQGWHGSACHIKSCPKLCNKKGICENGRCHCIP